MRYGARIPPLFLALALLRVGTAARQQVPLVAVYLILLCAALFAIASGH